MVNKSKDLKNLFRQYLINENKRSKVNYCYDKHDILSNANKIPLQYGGNNVRIYFYEWSDTSKAPRTFYQIDLFDSFLKSSGIQIEPFQRDIIKNLGTVFVTCYTGTKNLSICGTYKNLLDSLRDHNARGLITSIQRPKLIYEQGGRWLENDGTFFG